MTMMSTMNVNCCLNIEKTMKYEDDEYEEIVNKLKILNNMKHAENETH